MNKEDIVEACARAAHEANRAYCLALGDASQVSWEEAPDWQRSSCRKGAEGAMGGNTPRESHECWLEEKIATGWRHGPVKNPERKEHPCAVPYDDLPPEQKAKDFVFVTTVRAVAEALGWSVPELANGRLPGAPLPTLAELEAMLAQAKGAEE